MVGLKLFLQELGSIQNLMPKAEKKHPTRFHGEHPDHRIDNKATCSVGEIVACVSGAYTGSASCVC